jgi:hypothetical protein
MVWVALVLMALLFWAVPAYLLPRPSPRWRARIERLWRPVARLRLRRRRPAPPDPFVTLRLQTRLGVLADKIREVEATPRVYAKAHRLTALEAAYDDLLHEACRLAGAPAEPELRGDGDRRWREEMALATRGWSW